MSCAATPSAATAVRLSGDSLSRTFVADYAKGLANQASVLPLLEKHFGQRLIDQDEFAALDYAGESIYVEVKSRDVTSRDFSTTIIGQDKLICARAADKPVYLVFTFTDGAVSYIRYNERAFSRYTVRRFRREARPDHTDVWKDYCYIPISDLTPLVFPRPLFRS
jgi:hypothetical protein